MDDAKALELAKTTLSRIEEAQSDARYDGFCLEVVAMRLLAHAGNVAVNDEASDDPLCDIRIAMGDLAVELAPFQATPEVASEEGAKDDMVGCESFLYSYVKMLCGLLETVDLKEVENVIEVIANCRKEGGTLYVCGNGGSQATAAHFVCDMAKVPQGYHGQPFKAVALGCNPSLLTAWANDESYDEVFACQLVPLIGVHDVVMGISASGNSQNVLSAISVGNARGSTTIGLCGWDGGRLSRAAQHSIIVKSQHYGRIEDVHMAICHCISYYNAERIQAQVYEPKESNGDS